MVRRFRLSSVGLENWGTQYFKTLLTVEFYRRSFIFSYIIIEMMPSITISISLDDGELSILKAGLQRAEFTLRCTVRKIYLKTNENHRRLKTLL